MVCINIPPRKFLKRFEPAVNNVQLAFTGLLLKRHIDVVRLLAKIAIRSGNLNQICSISRLLSYGNSEHPGMCAHMNRFRRNTSHLKKINLCHATFLYKISISNQLTIIVVNTIYRFIYHLAFSIT